MKIVMLDGYTLNPGDPDWNGFSALGNCMVYDHTPKTEEGEIIGRMGDAEAVFTNKTPLSKSIFDICLAIRFVGVLVIGYNVVDIQAAKEMETTVSNIPSYGISAVGQFAVGLLLEIYHHIDYHDKAIHEGAWMHNPDRCLWDYPLIELKEKTMGIVGFGRVDQMTDKVARVVGMKVIANDRFGNGGGRGIADYVDRETLLRTSDVIALHCSLFPDTEGIINRENMGKMKNGVIMLNNSRGQLVVEQDLADALNPGKVYTAGLDVVSEEPIQPSNPLLGARSCIVIPHISWTPKESRVWLMALAVDNLQAFVEGKPVNVVNPSISKARKTNIGWRETKFESKRL